MELIEDDIAENVIVNAYPNPFNEHMDIILDLPESGHVNLDLFSLNGEKIKTNTNTAYQRKIVKFIVYQVSIN